MSMSDCDLGYSLLCTAAYAGDEKWCRILIENGAPTSRLIVVSTIPIVADLILRARDGTDAMVPVQTLVAAGVSPDEPLNFGEARTALMISREGSQA